MGNTAGPNGQTKKRGGRGRRVLLPDDTDAETPREVGNARIAWLLVTNRLLGPHHEMARRQPFLHALAERGRKVDPSTVSRWETGLVEVTDQTATLYEDVLGLPAGSLVAVSSGVRRTLGAPRSGAGRPDPKDLLELDLEPLIDRVSSGSGTGADWLALTRSLAGFDFVRMRRDEWRQLSTRIVTELSTSVGLAYVRRFEAAVDLLRRPEAVRHMVAAIADHVTAPDVQRAFPVVALLGEIDAAEAGTLATELLESGNPVVRMEAAWSLTVKLSRGHHAGVDDHRVEALVRDGLRGEGPVTDRLEYANLAAEVPESSWQRILADLPRDVEVDMIERARERAELVLSDQTRSIVDEMASTVVGETPAPVAVGHDPMLRRLLREAVLSVESARRLQAMLTIAATPYAAAVARHCRELAHSERPVLAARMQELLITLGGAETGDEPLRRALCEERAAIRARALIAIGVRRAGLAPREATMIADYTVGSRTRMDRASGLFALGMGGQDTMASLFAYDDLGPAAHWWETYGPARHDPDVVPDDA